MKPISRSPGPNRRHWPNAVGVTAAAAALPRAARAEDEYKVKNDRIQQSVMHWCFQSRCAKGWRP